MVTLQGSYTFDAPQDVVWEAVQDPDVLSQVLPGCERLEKVDENEYVGEINIRVGPVQGTFKGTVKLSNILAPDSYHIELEGQGRPGYVTGAGDLKLEGNGDQTTLNYTGEASLSGRIASVGQRLVDSTARSITRQGLESLDQQIQARLHPPEPEEIEEAPSAAAQPTPKPAPKVTPPTTTEVGMTVAKDVAKDVIRDVSSELSEKEGYSTRDVGIIVAAVLAIVWMWNLLFGD